MTVEWKHLKGAKIAPLCRGKNSPIPLTFWSAFRDMGNDAQNHKIADNDQKTNDQVLMISSMQKRQVVDEWSGFETKVGDR